MPGTNVLSDIRIADMTTVIFGPYCTQTLADMGADVVKVEPAGGDDFRNVGKYAKNRHMGPCHMTINRGKRSVVWDMKSEEGQEAIRRLIQRSDGFPGEGFGKEDVLPVVFFQPGYGPDGRCFSLLISKVFQSAITLRRPGGVAGDVDVKAQVQWVLARRANGAEMRLAAVDGEIAGLLQ